MSNLKKTGCLGNGFKRIGPDQDGRYYRVVCECEDCTEKRNREYRWLKKKEGDL